VLVLAEHEGTAEVRFPGFEDGAEVDVEDVVWPDQLVGWAGGEGEESVGSASDDLLVPEDLDAVAFVGELVAFVAQGLLTNAWADKCTLDLLEELDGFVLSIEKMCCAFLLGGALNGYGVCGCLVRGSEQSSRCAAEALLSFAEDEHDLGPCVGCCDCAKGFLNM